MELRPGLHRIQAPLGERFVALYLFVGSESALLVDTGIRESITETFLPYLESAGIDPAIVRWAVNTHCDFDHTGGNGALKAALPHVEIMAHRLDQGLTEDVQRLIDVRYGEFRDTDGFDDPPETTAYLRSVTDLVPLDVVLAGGEEFDLGGRSVRVLHVPGHSPGSRRGVRSSEPRASRSAMRRSAPRCRSRTAAPPSRRPIGMSGPTSHRSRRSAPSTSTWCSPPTIRSTRDRPRRRSSTRASGTRARSTRC